MTEPSVAHDHEPLTEEEEAAAELLAACVEAVAWFDRFDEHAPEGLSFGNEGRIRRRLRRAIRRQR